MATLGVEWETARLDTCRYLLVFVFLEPVFINHTQSLKVNNKIKIVKNG